MVTTAPGVDPSSVNLGGGAGGGGFASGLQGFGNALAIGGTVLTAVGAFYGVEAQRYNLRGRALDQEFAATTAITNARVAEREASDILLAARGAGAISALRFGQAKAATRARTAASGIVAGVGSAAEVEASVELAKQIDALTIERSGVRAAGAARMRAVDLRSRAGLARAAAISSQEFSSTLSPGLAALTSAIGGASQVSAAFLNQTSGF